MKSMIEGSNVLKPDFGWYNEPQQTEIVEIASNEKHEHCGKRVGQKSEVFAYEPADAAKMVAYFSERGMWIHYLLFTIQTNSARRVGDLIGYYDKKKGEKASDGLCWKDFFNPATGKFRNEIRSFQEQKTGKLASPVINAAMRDAITLYCEKTGCDPSSNGFENHVFLQLSGTHKGKVLSYHGALKALKEAAAACEIEYNVGTHSARKTFGATTKMLHPGDASCIEALQGYYNHSSSAITNRYIGLTKKKTDGYVEDMGNFFNEYIVGGKEIPMQIASPVISVDTEALFQLIQQAFYAGKNSDGSNDAALVIELTKQINNIRK